ncbi:MAG: hypothetical protein KF795_06680 [Labilithrix sp.]|nr:hypothetical protein [Labilithrix sp.]
MIKAGWMVGLALLVGSAACAPAAEDEDVSDSADAAESALEASIRDPGSLAARVPASVDGLAQWELFVHPGRGTVTVRGVDASNVLRVEATLEAERGRLQLIAAERVEADAETLLAHLSDDVKRAAPAEADAAEGGLKTQGFWTRGCVSGLFQLVGGVAMTAASVGTTAISCPASFGLVCGINIAFVFGAGSFTAGAAIQVVETCGS